MVTLFSETTNANDEFMVTLNRKLSHVTEFPKQNRDRNSAGYQTIDVHSRERSPIVRDNSRASEPSHKDDYQTLRQVTFCFYAKTENVSLNLKQE